MNNIINKKTKNMYVVYGMREKPIDNENCTKIKYKIEFLVYKPSGWTWVDANDYMPERIYI